MSVGSHLNLKSAAVSVLAALTLASGAGAEDATPRTGPVFAKYGKTYAVEADMKIPEGTEFKVAFDVSAAAKPGEINRGFDSAARFINMQVAAGVPLDKVHVALVVHGAAGRDLLDSLGYASRTDGASNANAPLIAALHARGVRVILCGQSAAAMGLGKSELLPGVEMALSAMTAHALLQQDGYTLNPF